MNVELNGLEGYKLQYRTHLSNVGWSNWANQGSMRVSLVVMNKWKLLNLDLFKIFQLHVTFKQV